MLISIFLTNYKGLTLIFNNFLFFFKLDATRPTHMRVTLLGKWGVVSKVANLRIGRENGQRQPNMGWAVVRPGCPDL